jgi:integrase
MTLENLIYLETSFDKPFTGNGFGNKFKDWCVEAGLPHCTAHGLRKAGATIAAENGATEHELMAIYGWESPKQAAIYTARRTGKSSPAAPCISSPYRNRTATKVSHLRVGLKKCDPNGGASD